MGIVARKAHGGALRGAGAAGPRSAGPGGRGGAHFAGGVPWVPRQAGETVPFAATLVLGLGLPIFLSAVAWVNGGKAKPSLSPASFFGRKGGRVSGMHSPRRLGATAAALSAATAPSGACAATAATSGTGGSPGAPKAAAAVGVVRRGGGGGGGGDGSVGEAPREVLGMGWLPRVNVTKGRVAMTPDDDRRVALLEVRGHADRGQCSQREVPSSR